MPTNIRLASGSMRAPLYELTFRTGAVPVAAIPAPEAVPIIVGLFPGHGTTLAACGVRRAVMHLPRRVPSVYALEDTCEPFTVFRLFIKNSFVV